MVMGDARRSCIKVLTGVESSRLHRLVRFLVYSALSYTKYPAAGTVPGLENGTAVTEFGELICGGHTCQTSPQDEYMFSIPTAFQVKSMSRCGTQHPQRHHGGISGNGRFTKTQEVPSRYRH